VLWHYSSFSYTLRGIPFPGILLGLVLRHRQVAVVTLLHEPAYAFGRRGLKGSIQALTQQLVLPLVLVGSDVLVVTTSARARALRLLPPPLRRPVHCLPVFSTLGEGREVQAATAETVGLVIGVPSWTSDGVQPQVLMEAVRMLPPTTSPRVLLLGAAEATSPEAMQWLRLAAQMGLADRIDFTGVVGAEELSRSIASCDLIVFVNGEGPSSRKTTLAAALAHGKAIVALDGWQRWSELLRAQAVEIAAPQPAALSGAIGRLLSDGRERKALASRAEAFYAAHMTLADVAGALETILAEATARGGSTP